MGGLENDKASRRQKFFADDYSCYKRVQHLNEPVASGSTKPTGDIQELAAAKRSC